MFQHPILAAIDYRPIKYSS